MSSTVVPSSLPDAGPGVEAAGPAWLGGWMRVAIALVLAGQGMAFGLAANETPPESPVAYWVLHGGLAASALLVLLLLGGPLLRECFHALWGGRITVDLLFLVSLLGALGASVFSTVQREGPIFYELVAILLAIYTVGKLLGARSRAKALQAVESLRAEHATASRKTVSGDWERVPVASIQVGETVRIAAGETIAVDGTITTGRSLVWTTPLTGEPDPMPCGPGDPVFAGMRAVDGVLTVIVTAGDGARRLDRMLRAIAEARLAPSHLQFAADRLAARFVPAVLLVCIATFVFWFWRGPLAPAVNHSLAVLVVACPCALGLATPLGIWSALVRLARLGLVARSGDFVEALATADVAFFDKTGTLCEPGLRVGRFTVLPASPLPTGELRALLAVAESGVDHPVATALRSEVAPVSPGSDRYSQLETRIVPGGGLVARVRDAGGDRIHEVVAGTARFLGERGIAVDEASTGSSREVLVAIDGVVVARIELVEQSRAHTAEAFAALRALGLTVEILTGDPAFARDRWPEIPRATGLTPEAKAGRVRAAQASGARVIFVGDGLNDAPALAAADVAIAIREGAELARTNALAVVGGDSLGTLPDAVRITRDVRAAIRSNLRFAVAYNAAAMALAAAGLVHPVLAALLMAASSLIVSTRVLRAGAQTSMSLNM